MNEYINHVLAMNEASANRDLDKCLDALDIISNSLGKLTNSLYEDKIKIESHFSELESKFFRYVMSNQSIITLLKGLNFKLLNNNIKIIDIFSIKSIVRYQIETYLVMFYLFFDKVETSELNLRYDVHKIHALNKQMTFAKKSDYAKKKSKEVQKDIQVIKTKIISSDKYSTLTDKEKNKLLNPKKAVIKDREKLFKESGLSNSRISDMWSIYSNYAHSEYISDRQFNSYYKLKTANLNEDNVVTIEICLILISRLAKMLTKQFDCCKNKFDSLSPKEKAIINLYGNLHD